MAFIVCESCGERLMEYQRVSIVQTCIFVGDADLRQGIFYSNTLPNDLLKYNPKQSLVRVDKQAYHFDCLEGVNR